MIPTPIAMQALMQTLSTTHIEQQRPLFEAAFFNGEWQMPLGDDADSRADRSYRRQSLHYRLAFAGWLAGRLDAADVPTPVPSALPVAEHNVKDELRQQILDLLKAPTPSQSPASS